MRPLHECAQAVVFKPSALYSPELASELDLSTSIHVRAKDGLITQIDFPRALFISYYEERNVNWKATNYALMRMSGFKEDGTRRKKSTRRRRVKVALSFVFAKFI